MPGRIHFGDARVPQFLKLLANPRTTRTGARKRSMNCLAGPETKFGLTKCSSRAMVRMSVPDQMTSKSGKAALRRMAR